MKYRGPTDQELSDAKSAVRWLALSTLFMIVAVVAQVVWFIMLVTNNPKTTAAFVVFVGTYILGLYCKWCSDDVKPESFK